MQRISSWNLPLRLLAHVATAKREPLLNEREVFVLQQDMAAFLTSEGFFCSAVVDKGQDALLKFLGDVDIVLPSLLMQGGFGGQWSRVNAPTWSCYCMQSPGVPHWMTQTVCWSCGGGCSSRFCGMDSWRLARGKRALWRPLRGWPARFGEERGQPTPLDLR